MSPVCQNATHLVVVLRERRYALIAVSWGWSCLLEFGLGLWLGLLHAQLRKLRGIRWIILQRETEKTVPERRVQPGQEAVAAAVVVAGEAEPPTPVQVHLRVPERQVDASPLEAGAAEEVEEGAAQDSHSILVQYLIRVRTAYSSSGSGSQDSLAALTTAAAPTATPPAAAAEPHLLAEDTAGTARVTSGATAARLATSSSSARFFASA